MDGDDGPRARLLEASVPRPADPGADVLGPPLWNLSSPGVPCRRSRHLRKRMARRSRRGSDRRIDLRRPRGARVHVHPDGSGPDDALAPLPPETDAERGVLLGSVPRGLGFRAGAGDDLFPLQRARHDLRGGNSGILAVADLLRLLPELEDGAAPFDGSCERAQALLALGRGNRLRHDAGDRAPVPERSYPFKAGAGRRHRRRRRKKKNPPESIRRVSGFLETTSLPPPWRA